MPDDLYTDYDGNPFEKPATPEEIRQAISDTFAGLGALRWSSWSSGVTLDPTLHPVISEHKAP